MYVQPVMAAVLAPVLQLMSAGRIQGVDEARTTLLLEEACAELTKALSLALRAYQMLFDRLAGRAATCADAHNFQAGIQG